MASKTKHNTGLSIAKGLCIIFMVIGHAGCPDWMTEILKLFRLPCFFILSGYFLSEKHINNFFSTIWKKIRGLYFPFIKWGIFFILMNNIFYKMYLTSNFYSYEIIKSKIVSLFYMWHYENFMGAFWFLRDLFISSVLILCILKIVRILIPKFNMAKFGWLFIIPPIIYISPLYKDCNYPVCLSIAFFTTGVYFRALFKNNFLYLGKKGYYLGALMFATTVIISLWWSESMHSCQGWDILIYYLIGVWTTLAFIILSKAFEHFNNISKILDFIGTQTLIIMVLHLLAFRIVSYIKIIVYSLPIEKAGDYPVINEHNDFFWIIYAFIGVSVPLLFKILFSKYFHPKFSFISLISKPFTSFWHRTIGSNIYNE